MSMSTESSRAEIMHRVKNHLAVILGFAELAMASENISDVVRADIAEIKKAVQSAMVELPKLEGNER